MCDPKFKAQILFDFPFHFVDNPEVIKKLREYMEEGKEKIEEILGVQSAVKDELKLMIDLNLK
jgi:hypothetical protein